MFFSKSHIELLEEEIKTLKRISETPFKAFSSRYINDGTTSNGGRWVVSSFCENTEAITNRFFHERYLLANFDTLIMPAMTIFYKSFDPEIVAVENWISSAEKRLEKHPEKRKLTALLNMIRKEADRLPGYSVVKSNIHHDLHARNILVRDNEITIIDWEGEIRSLVQIDVFDFSRRYLNKHPFMNFLFGLFMKGILKSPPRLVSKSLAFYSEWMNANFNVVLPAKSERLTVLIYALERSLLLFEKRGLNRLKDKKGIEYKIFKSIESRNQT